MSALWETWYNRRHGRAEILGLSLFAGISEESAAIVAAGGVTDVPAGQVLAQAGDQGFGMFVVLDGSVVVERGDLHIEMGRDGFFGELALLVPDSPRIARVRAASDARVLAVPRQTFDLLLETEPSFARALLRRCWRPGWCRRAPGTVDPRMSEQGWREFLAADGVDDWVVLHGGATAVFRVASLGEAARLAEAVAAVPGFEGSGGLLTIADRA